MVKSKLCYAPDSYVDVATWSVKWTILNIFLNLLQVTLTSPEGLDLITEEPG